MSQIIRIKVEGVLAVILGTVFTVALFTFNQYYHQFNVLILTLTLGVLVWYAHDTHRIADQTVEVNLRPVILRNGFIKNWDEIHFEIKEGRLYGKYIEFSVLKHIAKDIEGFIILNGKKFTLVFGNEISKIDQSPDSKNNDALFTTPWGWMNTGTIIRAAFRPERFEEVSEENSIMITYSDIEGNKYYTKEDVHFRHESGKL